MFLILKSHRRLAFLWRWDCGNLTFNNKFDLDNGILNPSTTGLRLKFNIWRIEWILPDFNAFQRSEFLFRAAFFGLIQIHSKNRGSTGVGSAICIFREAWRSLFFGFIHMRFKSGSQIVEKFGPADLAFF